ncbi:MAG: DUF1738 domain-containing protein [Parasporobacterium sp.]|nr:DUF1738 domain-containing protein [Parasporobacterium sp.]
MARPKDKEEFRKEIAENFANILEEKGLEWKKEWQGRGAGAPQNGVTKSSYRGCNAFWLSLVSMIKGYNDPRWVTMHQIQDFKKTYHPDQKWHLKKGSKATWVEYWYPYDTKEKKALKWDVYKQLLKDGRKPDEFRFSARYTAVFNASEVEGMPAVETAPAFSNPEVSEDELIRLLSEGMGVEIINDGGDKAYYSPVQDKIHLPLAESFTSEYAYNATTLHELGHATGHPTRLNRPQNAFFGTGQYAYEELVAEMCSCFMSADLKTELTPEHLENHKAYVQSWIQTIRDKPETLVKAIRDAQAAASYMDYKAGLITEKDYEKTRGSSMEIKPKEKELER